MFQERTLLERLRKPAQGPQTMHEDAGALMRSILRNMNRILNSRAGQFPAQPDYGIPSPSEIAHAYPDSVKVVQRRMRECIEKYEPRLKDVQVTQIESDEQIGGAIRDLKSALRGEDEPRSIQPKISYAPPIVNSIHNPADPNATEKPAEAPAAEPTKPN